MVQMNLTIGVLSNQRLLVCQNGRAAGARSRWVAQSDQPITAEVREATALQRTVALMQTPWSDSMVVPDRQHSEQARRELPMHGQVRSQNTVPVFYHEAFSHHRIPGTQQAKSPQAPGFRKACYQLLAPRA